MIQNWIILGSLTQNRTTTEIIKLDHYRQNWKGFGPKLTISDGIRKCQTDSFCSFVLVLL